MSPISNLRAENLDEYSFQSACVIHNLKGDIVKEIPGDICIFMDDGSYISASGTSLRSISADSSLQWFLEIPVHHQINLSHDKKRILVLSSEFLTREGVKTRDDRFLIVSLDGKILHDNTIGELLPSKELLQLPITNSFSIWKDFKTESSHFNSIFEIQEIPLRKDAPWLAPGNIIVNSVRLGVLVLTPDLKQVLHRFTYPRSYDHQVHDVQILPTGNLLLFNNSTKAWSEEMEFSSIDEVDPVTFDLRYTMNSTPEAHFFSASRSGAHAVNEDLLVISLEWQGVYVVSRKTGKFIYSNHMVNTARGFVSNQNVRMLL